MKEVYSYWTKGLIHILFASSRLASLLQHHSFRSLAENILRIFCYFSFAETEPKDVAYAATGELLEIEGKIA